MLFQVKCCLMPEKGVVPSCWRLTKESEEVAFTSGLKAEILSWMASGGL